MMAKRYMDSAGNQYFVRPGTVWGFKAYVHTTDGKEHGCRNKGIQFKESCDEAQADLDRLAMKKGWRIYHEGAGDCKDQDRDGKEQSRWVHTGGW